MVDATCRAGHEARDLPLLRAVDGRAARAGRAGHRHHARRQQGAALLQILQILQNSQNFADFWRARSRLYQNEILQENMRSTAFFKLYKICILLHRCNLKILAKNRFEKSAIFVKIQQNFANVAQ